MGDPRCLMPQSRRKSPLMAMASTHLPPPQREVRLAAHRRALREPLHGHVVVVAVSCVPCAGRRHRRTALLRGPL